MSLAYNFAQLFQGNDRAYGTESGGCDRGDPDLTTAGRWNDYMDRIEDHLAGRRPMGVYPMIHRLWPEGDWAVHWGCVDFDEGEEISLVHARNTVAVLRELEITGWIERSRSKGFHVWVFADAWVPARTMRRALLAACQLVDAPTKEINPKSEELRADQLGNYVRTMYPGALSEGHDAGRMGLVGGPDRGRGQLLHQPPSGSTAVHPLLTADDGRGRRGASQDADGSWRCCLCGAPITGQLARRSNQGGAEGHAPLAGPERGPGGGAHVGGVAVDGRTPQGEDPRVPRRVAIDPETQGPICIDCFVPRAFAARVSEADLGRVAELYKEPVRPRPQRTEPTPDMLSSTPVARLSPVALMIYRDGPLEGSGRGHTLWKLARLMREDGRHTFDEALELLVDADERWGKFSDRGDADYLETLLQQAWDE